MCWIWTDEFEINLRPVDRVLLTTLFSLTNTEIEYDVLSDCFNARIGRMPEIDKTLKQFELVISRLNQSMIRTIISEIRKIGVLNPSVKNGNPHRTYLLRGNHMIHLQWSKDMMNLSLSFSLI